MQLLDTRTPTHFLHRAWSFLSSKKRDDLKQGGPSRPEDTGPQITATDLLREIQDDFLGPFSTDKVLQMSNALKAQFRERLQNDPACMLPSYNHQLATGQEKGRYAALDLGGSTFRVAIIEFGGKQSDTEEPISEIVEMQAFRVGKEIKDLIGTAFFDWMAARIIETLQGKREGLTAEGVTSLPLALTWSFPVEYGNLIRKSAIADLDILRQTSPSSGRLQAMGKAFRAADGLIGQDLAALVEAACLRAGLAAKIHILLNDSSATLISRTYTHPSTRFGLILGTGVNVAGYLPLPLVGGEKLGERPEQWLTEAHNVVVNAELSMFGQGILPKTRWDVTLSRGLPGLDFQPLETMVSGMYLGEILRLILLEAIETTGIFGGVIPKAFQKPYSLGTEMLSMIESNVFINVESALEKHPTSHGSSYRLSTSDRAFLRSLASIISRRSAAIVATSIHAFWDLRREGLREVVATATGQEKATAGVEANLAETMVAFTGSVIENYPGYLDMCQKLVDDLVARSEGNEENELAKIKFIPAKESSLLGAGVALAAAMDAHI
ncbi:hypothetical protein FDECE_842 [Fusarium decemcellulare]|nr:hypothetical protein FDECE_842 [Fusarium decemcellulare]